MAALLKNILLTGEPGVGKTTLIKLILDQLTVKAVGFYTEEIKAGKTRKGFNLFTLAGQEAVIAHINKKSTYRVGKYGVDVKTFEDIAVPLMDRAIATKAPLLVIDEIGKMECFSKSFRDIVLRCLDSTVPILGSIQNFASPLINCVMNRDDVVLIGVTEANRNDYVSKIAELVKNLVKPAVDPTAKHKKRNR
jgi:nucleoside-triphosphatase